MKKHKTLETVDAALKALNDVHRAIDQDDRHQAKTELLNAQRELRKLREMVEKEKDI
jgi:hypothetical protein